MPEPLAKQCLINIVLCVYSGLGGQEMKSQSPITNAEGLEELSSLLCWNALGKVLKHSSQPVGLDPFGEGSNGPLTGVT